MDNLDENSEDDTSDESEDDEAKVWIYNYLWNQLSLSNLFNRFVWFSLLFKELTDKVEKEFFKALSMLKSKDKKIYDKEECKFFTSTATNEASQAKTAAGNQDSKKPFFMKDLERETILKK